MHIQSLGGSALLFWLKSSQLHWKSNEYTVIKALKQSFD